MPVSHTWNGNQIVLATEPGSRTVANLTRNPRARLALGDTRDVVVIDAVLLETVPKSNAPVALAEAYAAQADWDPRTAAGDYVVIAWRAPCGGGGDAVKRNGTSTGSARAA